MASETWEKRLCNLIKKYKPSADAASFRNQYREAVSEASTKGRVDAGVLLEAREYLEAWVSPSPPESTTAYRQWQKVYEARKSHIPVSILEAFLRRVPATPANTVDWESFMLSCPNASLIDVILDRRLVREQDLNMMVEARPVEFYESVALDVVLQRSSLRNLCPLWDECITGRPRPRGLMSREKVLVHCYSLLPGEEGNESMVSCLVNRSSDREKVLEFILDDHTAAVRLCRHLVFGPLSDAPNIDGKPKPIEDVLLAWVSRCEAELESGDESRAATAALVLAMIRLSTLIHTSEARVKSKQDRLAQAVGRATERATLRVLQKVEADLESGAANTPLSVLGNELHRAVQEYVRRLRVGTRQWEDSPERALRYERHLGSKRVIQQVLAALDEHLDENCLRDALEVALFNSGVRALGSVNERVSFNTQVHQAEVPGILPGDPVIVTRSGRCLGDDEDRLVLVKTRVRPATGCETDEIPEAQHDER